MPFRFDVFLSYARLDEFRLIGNLRTNPVNDLKRALESHRHPETGDSLRVCTDVEDFELGGDVEEAIRLKLRSAQSLVVFCSRAAAESKWVERELAWFAEEHPKAQMIGLALDELPSRVFASWFSDHELGGDLRRIEGEALDAWRRRVISESHRIAAQVWAMPLTQVHDRWQSEARQRTSSELVVKARARRFTDSDGAGISAITAYAAWPSSDSAGALLEVAHQYGGRLSGVHRAPRSGPDTLRPLVETEDGGFTRAGPQVYRATVSAQGDLILLLRHDGQLLIRNLTDDSERKIAELRFLYGFDEWQLALNSDQRFAASLGERSLRLFRIDLDPVVSLGEVRGVAEFGFIPETARLVVLTDDALLSLSLPNLDQLWRTNARVGSDARLVFSRDGKHVATWQSREGGGRLVFRDATSGETVSERDLEATCRRPAIVFDEDGDVCIVACLKKKLLLVPVNGEATVRTLFTGIRAYANLAVSPEGALAAVGAGIIAVWNTLQAEGPDLHVSPLTSEVTHLTFGGHSSVLAVADASGTFAVIDMDGQQTLVGPIRAHGGLAAAPSASNGQHELVLVHRDGVVTRWDLRPSPVLTSPVYSWKGQWLASIAEHSVVLWDGDKLERRGAPLECGDAQPRALAFAPNDDVLAVVVDDGKVRMYDLDRREEFLCFAKFADWPPPSAKPFHIHTWKICFHPSRQTFALHLGAHNGLDDYQDLLVICDVTTGEIEVVVAGPDRIIGIAWVDSDSLLIARPNSLQYWSLAQKTVQFLGRFEDFEEVLSINTAATSSSRLWGVAHGNTELVLRHEGILGHELYRIKKYGGAVLAPDGSQLAWNEYGAVAIWDMRLRAKLSTRLPPGRVLEFSPRDGWLLLIDADGRSWRWPVDPASARRIVGALVARELSQEERVELAGLDLDLDS
ncbi:MAG TPA: toll/interleukin-1 receptor domain-containing protein [Bryobacteraceae bacterium]|nr:toll/interleukin-1 receptor domain-containing protein [Bryobacteraceae bacterium]